MSNLPTPEIIAVVSALGGGVLVKIFDLIAARWSKRLDEAGIIRKELREEIREHKKEVVDAEQKISEWQQKYFDLLVQCKEEAAQMRAEIELLKRKVEARR